MGKEENIAFDEIPAVGSLTKYWALNEAALDSDLFEIQNYSEEDEDSDRIIVYEIADIGSQSITEDNYMPTDALELIKNSIADLRREGIEPPSTTCYILSEILISELIENGVKINRITASAEGGISFVFRNGVQVMYLEIYNDGEVGYIIEDVVKRKTIDNQDINFKNILSSVKKFLASE